MYKILHFMQSSVVIHLVDNFCTMVSLIKNFQKLKILLSIFYQPIFLSLTKIHRF